MKNYARIVISSMFSARTICEGIEVAYLTRDEEEDDGFLVFS